MLAGMIAAMIARTRNGPGTGTDVWDDTCRAVVWHGLAAERLARARGQEAVRTTDLLPELSGALRDRAEHEDGRGA